MARSKSDGIKINNKATTNEGVHDQIRVYLKRSGLGDGRRLRKILMFAYDHGGHFKQSEIPFRVDTHDLDKLVQAGYLSRIIVGNNMQTLKPLYESTIGKMPHSHFYCDICEEITDFDDTLVEEITEKICNYFGHDKYSKHFQINGKCAKCKE
jgi:hypothetical protein